uniref:Transcription factor HES-5 n=1 Tax=Sphaeramia orbicularis TaxID=375764 RepID=A0A672Z8U4_9TELE
MAPTITAAMTNSEEHLTLTHKVNLRKPLVEKLRRERINSSIEQLKSLLGPEFLQQQPDSKMEKADILEMTVCFLRRLQQQQKKLACFRSTNDMKTPPQLSHLGDLHPSSDKTLTEADLCLLSSSAQTTFPPVSSALWRPWSTPTDAADICQTN